MKTVSRLLALSCIAWASTAGAGVNSWTFTGPDGGPVKSAVFHPAESATVLVGSARGVHRSLNDGASWARTFEGDMNDISAIAFDPSRAARVFALGNGLYRSDDDARTFGPNIAPVANLVSMSIARDGVLYVVDMNGRLFRSGNAGASWTEIVSPWGIAYHSLVGVDPSDSQTVYVVLGSRGVYKSSDGGASWAGPLPGSPGTRNAADVAQHIAVHPTDRDRLIVATWNGLMHSTNGGATWSTQLAASGFVWAGFDPAAVNEAVALTWKGQIERSLDRGDTWPAILRPPRIPVHEAYEVALSPTTPGAMLVTTSEGPMFSEDAGLTFERRTTNISTGIAVALASANDGSIYASLRHPAGIYKRDGTTWRPVNNASLLDLSPEGRELDLMAVAAQNSSMVYSLDMDRRLMRSTDGGATWIGPHAQFSPLSSLATGLAADPTNPLVAYVMTSDSFWRSTDGGATWLARSMELPGYASHITISVSNPNVLYAAAVTTPETTVPSRYAVFRSADAGVTWAPTAALPSTDVILGITIDPTNPDIVYVDQIPGVARSPNGGASWSSIDFGFSNGNRYVGGAVVVDPVHPTTLIASANNMDLGFLRSVDGGATWRSTPLVLGGVRASVGIMTLHPQRPGLLVGTVAWGGMAEYEISPDLGVTIEGLGDRLPLGGSATARIVVRNLGPHGSSASHVSVTLPAVLTVSTPPAGCGLIAGKLECDLPALQVNGSRTITLPLAVAATPTSGGIVADVVGYEPDAVGANNQAFAGAIIETFSNLTVTHSALPGVTVGNSATMVATVSNAGPHVAPSTLLVIDFPAGAVGQSVTASQGSCAADHTTIAIYLCELGVVNPGASATVSVRVRGDTTGALAISTEASSPSWDPEVADNTRVTTFNVGPAPRPPPPRRSGGGGGLDWLALALLGGLLLVRCHERRPKADVFRRGRQP